MSPPAADKRTRPARGTRRFLLSPWPAAIIGGLCFLNIVFLADPEFVYDDRYIVRDNPRLHDFTDVRAIWLSDWWEPHGEEAVIPNPNRDRLYRPLTLFTFAVNYALGGLRPQGFYLANIVLHAAVCVLVWKFAQRLFGDAALSTCAALLFAVHPVHCEAVANVVGRAEVLSTLLVLVGLLILLPAGSLPGMRRALLAALVFFAALLAKETAVCYPVLALVGLQAVIQPRSHPPRRWWLKHTAVLLLPLIAYFPLRYVSLERQLLRAPITASLFNPLRTATPVGRVTGPFTILGHYTRVLVVPNELSCDYGTAIVDPNAGPNAMTLLGAVAAAGGLLALLGYRRPRSSNWRRMAVAAALAAASYALFSNTVLLIGVTLAERFMYLPSVLILILIAAGVMWVWRDVCAAGRPLSRVARLLRYCGVLLLFALALRSIDRNSTWASNADLFFTDVRTHPEGAHLNKAAAGELLYWVPRVTDDYERARLLNLAEPFIIRALQIYPRYPEALQTRGRIHAMLGDADGAISYFESALQLAPQDTTSQRYLAQVRGEAEAKEARLAELLHQIEQQPDDPTASREAGRLLIESGRPHEALKHLERAAELAPRDLETLHLLAQVYMLHFENERAKEVLYRVLTLDPDDWEAHTNLSALLAADDPAAALQHARQAHRLRPDDLRSNVNLAEAYAANEQYRQALERYYLIRDGFPENHPFRAALRDRIAELERWAD